jgi:ribose transport system substrate-binding protein
MTKNPPARLIGLFALCVLGLALAACGSTSSSSATSSSTAASSSSAAQTTGSDASAALAAAAARVAPYIGRPSQFPVDEKLARRPVGATFAYVDCGTPVCALLYQVTVPAAKAMGVNLVRIKAGETATAVQTAFDSVLSLRPKAVFVGSIDIGLWGKYLKELLADKIPVEAGAVTGLAPYAHDGPLAPSLGAETEDDVQGRLLADYVASRFGINSQIVVYTVPELSFTSDTEADFRAELAKVCPTCSVRVVPIDAATLGNTAPNTVVSDLQSHPKTTVAFFADDEIELGLPDAMKAAGVKVNTVGFNAAPFNLKYVKAGEETVALDTDLPLAGWEAVDALARLLAGQALSGPEGQGLIDFTILTQKEITFNPANGWTGYPDFAKRFLALWGVKG